MAGTVASVSGQKGSHVSGGGNAPATSSSTGFIELADLGRLTMNVSLSESDIGKVHVGESATVTIDAVAGAEEAAHVTSVAVLPTSSSSGSGAVSYPVTITLDQSTHGVRPGMSATADIVVARAHGVVVPNQALQGTTVTVQNGKKRTAQPVQVGVVGDSSTEILSGLHAGETIVVTSTSALAGRNASGSASSAANGRGNVVFGPGFGGGLRPGGFRQTVVGGGGP
jgi:hypothetical protein